MDNPLNLSKHMEKPKPQMLWGWMKNTPDEGGGKKIGSITKVNPQSPSGEPYLQVIDYINWAVQRAFIKQDIIFYKFIEEKIKYLVDIYNNDKYPKNFYNSRNKFDISKISPL